MSARMLTDQEVIGMFKTVGITPAAVPTLASHGITDAIPTWVKVATKTFTDLSAAALTNNITVYTLPAKTMIHGAMLRVTTGFSGGAIGSYTLSLGITGTLAKYITAADSTVVATLNGIASVFPVMENFAATTAIKLAATSTVANLSVATAGSVDIYLHTVTLP